MEGLPIFKNIKAGIGPKPKRRRIRDAARAALPAPGPVLGIEDGPGDGEAGEDEFVHGEETETEPADPAIAEPPPLPPPDRPPDAQGLDDPAPLPPGVPIARDGTLRGPGSLADVSRAQPLAGQSGRRGPHQPKTHHWGPFTIVYRPATGTKKGRPCWLIK